MAVTWTRVEGGVCAALGFQVSSVYGGIRSKSKDDLTLIVSEVDAQVAGVFTTNQVHAWCVAHNRERLKQGPIAAIICNAGNANCCNGERGESDDQEIAALLSTALKRSGVLTASTGVIGKHLPMEKVRSAVPALVGALQRSVAAGDKAAAGIMTTDLVSKSYAIEAQIDGRTVRIGGMAKGSGMIAPNMATMLGFLTTDANLPAAELQEILSYAVTRSFNRITVDGDTSTNDMVLLMANGRSGSARPTNRAAVQEGVLQVCQELAKMIARDGEGATKMVTIRLVNAPPGGDTIAKTIAESPLVKTACFGNDPNWGRIMAAAGRSGVTFDPRKVSVSLAGTEVFTRGEPTAFQPALVSAAMKAPDLEIVLTFDGPATEEIVVWTCDFSYDYVKINADYTT
jgi:glutamate N-acetyltransferase/amino-acid N-acetyltransferase